MRSDSVSTASDWRRMPTEISSSLAVAWAELRSDTAAKSLERVCNRCAIWRKRSAPSSARRASASDSPRNASPASRMLVTALNAVPATPSLCWRSISVAAATVLADSDDAAPTLPAWSAKAAPIWVARAIASEASRSIKRASSCMTSVASRTRTAAVLDAASSSLARRL